MCDERLCFSVVHDGNETEYIFTIEELQKRYTAGGGVPIKDTDKVTKCIVGNIPLYVENFGELVKVLGINKNSYVDSIRELFKKYSIEELEKMYTKEQIITNLYVPVYKRRPLSSYNKQMILLEIRQMFYAADRVSALCDAFLM